MKRRFIGSPRATVAGVGIILAVGAALVVARSGPAGSSSDMSSSSVAPTVAPRFTLVGGPAAGYEMRVPASWTQATPIERDAQRWVGAEGAVMVSYGASIFDGGAILECGPPSPEWPDCMQETYPYSIPYDPAHDGVGPLEIDGYVRDRCPGGCTVTMAETMLGGESAQRVSTITAGTRATYVATFHDRRPVIVFWSEPVQALDDIRLDAMLASFRFIDPEVPIQTPFVDPTELVPYTNTQLGYEIRIPRFWEMGADRVGAEGVRDFGSGRGAGTHGYPALSISVGSKDGTVTLCQGESHRCDPIVVTELADLEARLVSVPSQFPGREDAGNIVLDGHEGRFKRPRYRSETSTDAHFGIGGDVKGDCLGCPGMLYHAFVVDDGRPVVISIDWWTLAFGELPSEYTGRILSSFRFVG